MLHTVQEISKDWYEHMEESNVTKRFGVLASYRNSILDAPVQALRGVLSGCALFLTNKHCQGPQCLRPMGVVKHSPGRAQRDDKAFLGFWCKGQQYAQTMRTNAFLTFPF